MRFTRFWESYPRHDAKQEALRAWKALAPDEILLARMLAAIAAQRQWRQWIEGKIPHAATWLRGRRWEDERPPEGVNGHGRTAGNVGAIQAAIARVGGGA